jgi:hypothetical protein
MVVSSFYKRKSAIEIILIKPKFLLAGVYETRIMKYSYELNEFEYIGEMLYPRIEAAGFIVEDVQCS